MRLRWLLTTGTALFYSMEVEAGGSEAQDHPWLHRNLKTSLVYVIPIFKKDYNKYCDDTENRMSI